MAQTSNVVICRNRVEIEGIDVGQFETLSLSTRRGFVGTTGILTLPAYGIGITESGKSSNQQTVVASGTAKRRVRSKIEYGKTIKVGAKVEIFCWYESPQFDKPLKVFDTVKVFSGFIEQIAEGFPNKFYLRDATFILKFGRLEKAFNENAPLSTIINECINTSKEAFAQFRFNSELDAPVVFDYSPTSKGLQLDDEGVAFNNFAAGRTPYQVIEYLAREMVMYAGCTVDNAFFFGYRGTKTIEPTVKLSTKTNVINRDIVGKDNRFVDYEVVVTSTDKEGKKVTGRAGSSGGVQIRKYVKPVGKLDVTQFAKDILGSIEGVQNEGEITLLLYPKIEWLDVVDYEDTIFDLSTQFFVMNYTFTANDKGYYQKLGVTDKVFMI